MEAVSTMNRVFLRALLICLLPTVLWAAEAKDVAPQRVYDWFKEGSGLWLIDVRGAQAFAADHIEGAVNIPVAELAYKRFPKQKLLVLTDDMPGDLEARAAAQVLTKAGQERVFVLSGGLAGWRRAGLPTVDVGGGGRGQLSAAQLAAAQNARVPMRLLDLRDPAERKQGPVAGAEPVPGKHLEEKLLTVRKQLEQESKKNLAAKLQAERPTVLIFPATAAAETLVRKSLWDIPSDVRYVEGGYLATAGRSREVVSTTEGCATCPGK